jgi:putative membrane protein
MKNKLTMISRFGIVSVLLGLLCFAGGAKAAEKSKADMPAKKNETPAVTLSAKDKAFMMKAAKGGAMEVEWGKWAAQNGQNADVKKFGNRMVTDHSKAGNELMALAGKKGVKLPVSKVSGKWKSDKDYMDMMVKDHQEDWNEFRAEAKDGTDPDLKKWAGDTSKMIQKHLELAKKTQSKLK